VRGGGQNRVDALRGKGRRRPVLQAQRLVALEQAAVDEQPSAAEFDQGARAGDGGVRAEEAQLEGIHGGTLRDCAAEGLMAINWA